VPFLEGDVIIQLDPRSGVLFPWDADQSYRLDDTGDGTQATTKGPVPCADPITYVPALEIFFCSRTYPSHSDFSGVSSASGMKALAPPIDPPYKKALFFKRNGTLTQGGAYPVALIPPPSLRPITTTPPPSFSNVSSNSGNRKVATPL
jgi:hypothetical protein